MPYREAIPLKQPIDLDVTLPGSKSITNRAFLCAALAKGKSVISDALLSDDTGVMLKALHKLQITNYKLRNGNHVIEGTGGRFPGGQITLNLGNAGTATRFLTAIMALREGTTIIAGDKRMRERPIRDLVEAVRQLGAEVAYVKKSGCPPLKITRPITLGERGEFAVQMKSDQSSQYLSALLMMAPLLPAPLRIQVEGELTSRPYITTTLAVMEAFGVQVEQKSGNEFYVTPQSYKPSHFQVEGDASAASYFYSLQYLHGGRLRFTNLDVKKSIQGDSAYPKALTRLGQGPIDMNKMPDVAMTLAVTAPFAESETEIRNVGNLRIKETDRLAALETELKKIGVLARVDLDSLHIKPLGFRQESIQEVEPIETYHDHRVAMCFAVVGTKIPGIRILDPGCVSKTYPDFWQDLEKAYLAPLHPEEKNMVLIGMRGCGKNHLGQRIAKHLRRPFFDVDHEVEKEIGMPIAAVVEKFGWDYFRAIEHKICSSIITLKKERFQGQPLVIATGGGVILNPLNMKHLKENALTLFIFVNPPVLAERLEKEGAQRPPLKEDQTATSEIETVWRERRSLYLKYADVVWDNTSGRVIEELLKDVFQK